MSTSGKSVYFRSDSRADIDNKCVTDIYYTFRPGVVRIISVELYVSGNCPEVMNHVVNPIFYANRIILYRQACWQTFGRATNSEVQETYVSTINVISYIV